MAPSKVIVCLLAAAAAWALAPATAQAQAEPAAHAHAHAAAPAAVPAKPWAADANLQDGMGRIHAALQQLRHYQRGHADAAFAVDQVAAIEEAAADIFAKCKLAPAEDAVMHGMLGPLLAATQAFKADTRDKAQIDAMRKAVADYPRYFDLPQWPVTDSHAH